MNYRGSYRKLLGNSKAALLAAIEVYNKPVFQYRDECAVILLMNAWELALKAILSKKKKSIFYPKEQGQPYRTLSWQDALSGAESHVPNDLRVPIRLNLKLLSTYRDNAIHFYNASGFGVVVHALAQTSILNYRELSEMMFGLDLAADLNWHIMPIGVSPPMDIVDYIAGRPSPMVTGMVRQFRDELVKSIEELESSGLGTGGLLMKFDLRLESVRNLAKADATIAVTGKDQLDTEGLTIVRRQDPNKSHPLMQRDVVEKIKVLYGKRFTSHVFQAIALQHDLKDNPIYCWRSSKGTLTLYSTEVLNFIKRLTASDVEVALTNYRGYLQTRRKGQR